MEPSYPPQNPQKKGLSGLAWLGIGCGGIVVLIVIAGVIIGIFFGPKLKQFGEDVVKNPTRSTATMMISVSGGKFEMTAEDDVKKRYTVRDKATGKMTTIYWDAKKQAPAVVQGDFSAVPADANAPSEPAPK